MSPVDSEYAEVNGTKFYYEIAGEGPLIIFVHGWGFDRRSWDYQFEEYSKRYQVIRYDQRGFGRSAEPVSGEEYSHAGDLRALMDHMNIEKAHLIGHSFGGRHVTILSVLHPDRMLSLTLADRALPGYQANEDSAELMNWISETWIIGIEVSVDAAKERFFYGAPEGVLNHALSNPKSAMIVEEMMRDYSGYNWTIDNNHIEPQVTDRLGEIMVPTLVIVAARGVIHKLPAPATIEEANPLGRKAKKFSTVDAYRVKTYIQLNEEGKAVATYCEWNASDAEALHKVWEKIPELPPEGIYPMMVVDSEDFR